MAESMVNEMNAKHGRRIAGVAPSMIDRMMIYDWPGNARDCATQIERAVILCTDELLSTRGTCHRVWQFDLRYFGRGGCKFDSGTRRIDCRRSRETLDSAHVGGNWRKQDAGGGDPGRESEDPAQQAEGIQPKLR